MNSPLSNSKSNNINGEKSVIIRVKRKLNQSPVEALWIEINERPKKRPLLDFHKLSIDSSPSSSSIKEEELKVKRVFVQHVETVRNSEDTIHFLNSFVEASPEVEGDSKFTTSTSKQQRRTLSTNNIHDRLKSKAKQHHQEQAQSARFEQIWKHRGRSNDSIHNEALGEVCRVYDIVRVDMETSRIPEKREEISAEDQEALSRFLPLLRECMPGAAEEIESNFSCQSSKQDSIDGYVYDLYAVTQKIDDVEAPPYPFPVVQLDDDDQCYDGPDDSDYETDDSNAENHPWNDYPEEESSDEDDKSETSDSESEEDESETERDICLRSDDDAVGFDRSEDPLFDEDMDEEVREDADTDDEDGGNGENWRWAYRGAIKLSSLA